MIDRITSRPLVWVFAGAVLGVLGDRFGGGICGQIPRWLLGICGGGWLLLIIAGKLWNRKARWPQVVLLMSVAVAAGVRHHACWWMREGNHIDWSVTSAQTRIPLVIRGRIVSQPNWVFASPVTKRPGERDGGTRTRMVVAVESVRDKGAFMVRSGKVEVFVRGQVSDCLVGDHVELVGTLSRIRGPTNPGGFDYRQSFRGKGIGCWFSISHPEGVKLLTRSTGSVAGGMSRLRVFFDRMVWAHVSAERAPLASAMLLGNRRQLDRLTERQFVLTGTIHLLAISGLHVGVLALFASWLPRATLLSRRGGLVCTVAIVLLYAWLVEFRPPVLRATVLISVICLCKGIGRQSFSFNTLSAAGLVVLSINPTDVFNGGAQLSFLAVAGLIYFQKWLTRDPTSDPIERLIEQTRAWPKKCMVSTWDYFFSALKASTIVWLVTLPLVVSCYHVVSPVSLIANPLLLLPIGVAMLAGFGLLLFGWGVPMAGEFFGNVMDGSLATIQGVVGICECVPKGHWWSSGPTQLAVVTFYVVLLGQFLWRLPRWKVKGWGVAILVWVAIGWTWPTWQARSSRQRLSLFAVTCIDVGHGNAVLLQLPGGTNVIYDCGTLGSPASASRQVSGVLWSQRITHLHAVVLSHADSDHYNGLFDLLERFSIGKLIVTDALLAKQDRDAVRSLLAPFRQRGIPIEAVSKGDHLHLCADVRMEVLSPVMEGFQESDNADSLVLELEYGGFRMLLPGDVEGAGMDDLLKQRGAFYQVVMGSPPWEYGEPPRRIYGLERCEPSHHEHKAQRRQITLRDRDPLPGSGRF